MKRRARARTHEPLVSIIIPAWNAERTLERTLRSVAAQTYAKLELIIVDDGSTDGTGELAARFCQSERRAQLIRQPNGGVAAARNRAITAARGEWIAPVDADDLWHPAKIEKQVAAAAGAPERPGFVYCWRRLIDEEDRVVTSGLRIALSGRAFGPLSYMNAVECGSSLLVDRKALLEVGGYDSSLRAASAQGCEDMLVQLQIAGRYPIAVVPEHLVGWRLHGANMSSDLEQMERSSRLVFERLQAQGAELSASVIRRTAARDAFDMAEAHALDRRLWSTMRMLGRALRLDPPRTGVLLSYRIARALNRRLAGKRDVPRARKFADVDPREVLSGDPYELASFRTLIDALDDRRRRKLTKQERAVRGGSAVGLARGLPA